MSTSVEERVREMIYKREREKEKEKEREREREREERRKKIDRETEYVLTLLTREYVLTHIISSYLVLSSPLNMRAHIYYSTIVD